jgi:plasmid stability protein
MSITRDHVIPGDSVVDVSKAIGLLVRLDPELHAQLKAFAAANDRTIAAEVRRALIAHLGASARPVPPPVERSGRKLRAEVEPRFKP